MMSPQGTDPIARFLLAPNNLIKYPVLISAVIVSSLMLSLHFNMVFMDLLISVTLINMTSLSCVA